MKNNFSASEISFVKSIYPTMRINKAGNITINAKDLGDNRDNSLTYTFYKHNDGIRIRRAVQCWFCRDIYQLFRNSRTNSWPAFNNIESAIVKFSSYISNIK